MKPKTRGKPTTASSSSTHNHHSSSNKIASTSKRKGNHSPNRGVDETPMPEFVDLSPFDDESLCPRFRNLISRDPDMDPATTDELDTIQHELEEMLMHNMDRQKKLTEQLLFLTNGGSESLSKKKDRLMPVFQTRTDSVQDRGARSKQGIKPPSSRANKDNPSFYDTVHNVPIPSTDRLGRRRVFFWPQNHMPEKFWDYVSELCLPITVDDIAGLQQLAKECSEDRMAKFLRVPGTGTKQQHYTLRQSDDVRSTTKRRASNDLEAIRDKRTRLSESTAPDEQQLRLGPLTERLVQALIDEQQGDAHRLQRSSSGEAKDIPEMNGISSSPNRSLIKSLNLGNINALERRIKKELELQGLLDDDDDESDEPHDVNGTNQEDEVTRELRQRQRELRELAETNRSNMQILLTRSRERLAIQKLEDSLAQADAQIVQLFSKFYSLVPKRKPTNKKERDQLTDALTIRRDIIKKLDAKERDMLISTAEGVNAKGIKTG